MQRATTIGAAVLLLVTIRSLAEVYRLEFHQHRQLVARDARLFVAGSLIAAIAQAATQIIDRLGRPRLAAVVPPLIIAGLFVWKVFFGPKPSGEEPAVA